MAQKLHLSTSTPLALRSAMIPASFEIEEADSTARHRIRSLKGTTGRYGIGDYFKFKVVVALKEYFYFAKVNESKQRHFYDQFRALKEALRAKSQPQIKQAYDGLIKIARTWAPSDRFYQQPYEEAVLSILKEELSEQTTQGMLHDILVHEGAKLIRDAQGNISLPKFAASMNGAAEAMEVQHHYGTKEEAKKAFIEAAVRGLNQEGHENTVAEFVNALEESAEKFPTQNFAPADVIEPYLMSWAHAIDKYLLAGTPFTRDVLNRIQSGSVFLMDHLPTPEAFMKKIEQICVQREEIALSRQVQVLDQREKQIREKMAIGQGIERRSYNREEVLQFIGEDLKIRKRKGSPGLDSLDSTCRQQWSRIQKIRQRKELLDNLPKIQAAMCRKEKELHALKEKYASSSQLFDMMVQLHEGDDRHPLENTKRYKDLLRNIEKQEPSPEMRHDAQLYYETSRELSRLQEDRETAQGLDITQTRKDAATLPQLEQELDQSKEVYLTAFLLDRLETMDSFELSDHELLRLSKVATGPQSGFLAEALQRAQKTAAELKLLKEELDEIKPQAVAAKERFKALQQNSPPVFTQADFPPEVIQSLTQQVHEQNKAYAKETLLKTVDIADQIAAVKAKGDLQAWEDTFRNLDPSLQQAYLTAGRVIVQFSPEQLSMVRCQELKDRLVTL
ncbi:MAG: hypothetical protein JSS10_01475 [Verrucomicrobia bacterium]|nr:hypothetical protein [Verrucomicrobiota bacterium]